MAQRITLSRGKLRKKFVLERRPWLKVGDQVGFKGQPGVDWFVSKVEEVKGPVYHIDFPAKKKRCVDVSPHHP